MAYVYIWRIQVQSIFKFVYMHEDSNQTKLKPQTTV